MLSALRQKTLYLRPIRLTDGKLRPVGEQHCLVIELPYVASVDNKGFMDHKEVFRQSADQVTKEPVKLKFTKKRLHPEPSKVAANI